MKFSPIATVAIAAALIWLKPNSVPQSKHNFIVIAHRGDHVIYPENTLEAYREAIKNEADYIEIDLRTTKDSQLVSMHDATVNRMTNGKGAVNSFTLAELQQLKLKGGDSVNTYHVPTFVEILKLAKNKINIYLDFKAADPAVAYQMIQQYHMEKQVLVYINSAKQLTGWRKVAPKMPLMLSLPDSVTTVDGMKTFIDKYRPDLLDGDYGQYNPDMLAFAATRDIPVWPDIQSATEGTADWSKAVKTGFKGLQTDHPAALAAFLKQQKLR
ncbi:glycerophosphodiester phosphodiesterase family protein [Mucilaginibacter psychrotolerans]|uniref:Glycerophosphodiester phosphodiesterase family protein n=1 Tax=Mucilaginibacter psychrotolerans TaxID=1524096 RepID=A0A4Y8SIV0_9SPHI|nr:glycerophosphodiester phosphodiesterase family protein [Mucilaginibacter psychrotolerans]TFF38570.1 glycerophosphodiester phosphodiesterase family protein [Mucilaginibacter psychrotolerans]